MKVIIKFYKNSNTGELIKSQQFTETGITGIPVYFYNIEGKCVGENLTLEGFVEIKEKKFKK
jgi:hypothetical protein